MTKFLLGKPADQGSRVAKLSAASDVRPAKRPDGAAETPLWNGSFRETIVFRPDEPQNGELPARRGRRASTAKTYMGNRSYHAATDAFESVISTLVRRKD